MTLQQYPTNHQTRTEHDLIGNLEVPADAYYGVHTARAQRNFQISKTSISVYPELINALVAVKYSAASADHCLGQLDEERARAIQEACSIIRSGRFHEQFVVDVFQGAPGPPPI